MNDLLICALAVGKNDPHKATIKARNIHGSVRDGVWLVDTEEWYDPRTNDAQAMELLKWLIKQDKTDFNGLFGTAKVMGWTINEAIIKAVVAMEESK